MTRYHVSFEIETDEQPPLDAIEFWNWLHTYTGYIDQLSASLEVTPGGYARIVDDPTPTGGLDTWDF